MDLLYPLAMQAAETKEMGKDHIPISQMNNQVNVE